MGTPTHVKLDLCVAFCIAILHVFVLIAWVSKFVKIYALVLSQSAPKNKGRNAVIGNCDGVCSWFRFTRAASVRHAEYLVLLN